MFQLDCIEKGGQFQGCRDMNGGGILDGNKHDGHAYVQYVCLVSIFSGVQEVDALQLPNQVGRLSRNRSMGTVVLAIASLPLSSSRDIDKRVVSNG
jgi:hypothetical protein